ncbi:MAG: tetratricopeptide repeat protein, partial [Deltaproteobacteria bacterium]|nr:tetratricopeptide repeat protein [Deltaproteobacteria bacterium]
MKKGIGVVMKVLGKISLWVPIVFFLTVGLSHGQSTVERIVLKGLDNAVQGNLAGAKTELQNALKVDPHYAPVKDYLKALEDVNNGKLKPQTAIAFLKGAQYAMRGEWAKAIERYAKAIKMNPRFAMAYSYRGVVQDVNGRFRKALSDHKEAVDLDPTNAMAYTYLGLAYSHNGKNIQAIENFTRAIQINPRLAMAYYNRGISYSAQDRYDQAILDYDKAIEINPRYARAFNNRGNAYLRKEKPDNAI